jgi:hypothetical protein
MSKRIFKLIKNRYNNYYNGVGYDLTMQYGYHHGNQCYYVEVNQKIRPEDTLWKSFNAYDEILYVMDDKEIIFDTVIKELKKLDIHIDEIQLLTEVDIAIEEILSDV